MKTAWRGKALRCGWLSCLMQVVVYIGAILSSQSFNSTVLLMLLVLSLVAFLLSVVAWLHTRWWILATLTAAWSMYGVFVLLAYY